MPTSTVTMMVPKPGLSVVDATTQQFAYRSGQDSPSAVRGVKIYGVPGKIVRQWVLMCDATHVLNVDNTPVHPDSVYDSVQSLASEHLILSFKDNTGSVFRDESETVNVKIEEVSLQKLEVSGNWVLRIVVTEVV